ncbi:PLP-dependent cysteine synthase family protein [Sphingobacterium sp. LRF_L2]|uniref:PLP-dependent cysteine synthase family protein n=1 Tax=Sphingobacterium sp. LRF_L2 TaxID=3369421 RepID=UPI003F5EB22C
MTTAIIGNTPFRKCETLSQLYESQFFIKEEFHNPSMSAKDRPAFFMIREAIAKGQIKPGGTFVEASSGNTGLGIATFAKQLGYQSQIFVSKSCSSEKIDALRMAGARVEICENSNGLHDFYSTQFRAQSYAATHPNSYFTNQYYNPQNIRSHYKTTGPELWKQTAGQITHFIAGIGTGGTISGVGRYLKEQNPNITIWGVEPKGSILSEFLTTGAIPEQHATYDKIEGIGRSFIPGAFDRDVVDHIFQVDIEEAEVAARQYRQLTGSLVGYSSAALLASLQRHKEQMGLTKEQHIVLFFPDHGSRYVSKIYSDLFDRLKTSLNIS